MCIGISFAFQDPNYIFLFCPYDPVVKELLKNKNWYRRLSSFPKQRHSRSRKLMQNVHDIVCIYYRSISEGFERGEKVIWRETGKAPRQK